MIINSKKIKINQYRENDGTNNNEDNNEWTNKYYNYNFCNIYNYALTFVFKDTLNHKLEVSNFN